MTKEPDLTVRTTLSDCEEQADDNINRIINTARAQIIKTISGHSANVAYLKEADKRFGKLISRAENVLDTIEVNDHSEVKYVCPITGCGRVIYKLKRHLENQHPNLTKNDQKFAYTFAVKLGKNCSRIAPIPKKSSPS